MPTFLDLQTDVRNWVIDLPTRVTNAVPGLINKAMRRMQTQHNFIVMEATTAALVTVTLQRTLAARPADFKEFRGNPYRLSFTNQPNNVMVLPDRRSALQSFDNDEDGYPQALIVGEPTDVAGSANFEVWPLPDGNSDFGDGEYRIYVPYWKFLPALVGNSDTNWFTVNTDEWLVYQSVAEAFAFNWDEDRAILWTQKAMDKFREVVNRDKLARVSTLTTFVPHYQGVRSPTLHG